MPTVQLNCRINQDLANRLKQAATARQQTLGTLVAQGIELLLAAPSNQAPDQLATVSTELAEQLAALVKRLEALEAERPAAKPASSKQAIAAPSPKGDTGGAITTAELAKLTETNRAGWNNWAAKATPGDTRHHPEAGSWQLVGKAVADAGGPARWLWKQA